VIGNISQKKEDQQTKWDFKYAKFPNFGPFKIPFPNKYAKKIKTHKDEHLKKNSLKLDVK
jgi:hypothetical protein